jgi:hypothetical protein
MKFTSLVFPNLVVSGGGIKIKFEDGIYETEDIKEIEFLESAGFIGEASEVPVEEVKPVKKPRRKTGE